MNFLANFISTTASIHDNDDRVEVTFQRNYFKNTNYFVCRVTMIRYHFISSSLRSIDQDDPGN